MVEDKELREALIEKGYQQIKNFSWPKAAKETLEVFNSLS